MRQRHGRGFAGPPRASYGLRLRVRLLRPLPGGVGASLTKADPSKISAGFWAILTGMDIQTIWIIVVAVSTPIAGVVGFAIQLRQVKKARLENLKLQLEIENLREQLSRSSGRIHIATPTEIRRVTGVLFSRSGRAAGEGKSEQQKPEKKR